MVHSLLLLSITLLILVLVIKPPYALGQTRKAGVLYNTGNFSGAISMLNKELAANPHNIRILLGLGISFDNVGEHNTAAVYFKQILKEADSKSQYAQERGVAMDGFGNHEDAIRLFKQALHVNPHDIFALYGLGHVFIELKNYTGANLTFDQVLNLPIPNLKQQPGYVEALVGKALSLFYLHDYKTALNFLNAAIKERPTNPSAYYNKGLLLQKMGDFTGAIDNYNKALAITPNDKDAQHLRQYAIQSLENDLYKKGRTLNDQEKYTESLPYLKQVLALNASNIFALDGMGTSLVGLQRYSEAVPYFEKVLKVYPKDQSALVGKAASFGVLGRYHEALNFLNAALRQVSNDTAALDNKGLALFGLGDYIGALKYIDRSLALTPHNTFALYNKGWALQRLGNYTAAIYYYDKELRIKYDADAIHNKKLALQAFALEAKTEISKNLYHLIP